MTIEEHMKEHTTSAEQVPNNAAGAAAIAPLWKRLVAYFLDWILLAVIGMCIGFFLFDALARIGAWGAAVGFVIAIIYFGICDSRIRNGQSFGKIAMKIRVVSRSGAPLNLPTAFLRAAIPLAPYFLIGAPFDLMTNFWLAISSALILGTALGLGYLLLFNRTTRRSLHDLAAGSTVIRADDKMPRAPATHRLWRGHIVAVVLLFAVAALSSVLITQITQKEPFISMLALQTQLSAEPGVIRVNVTDGTTRQVNGKETVLPAKILSIHVAVQSRTLYDEAFADKIARTVLDRPALLDNKDLIIVTISYGYDIGIASAQDVKNFTRSPGQWQMRLSPPELNQPEPDQPAFPQL